MATNNEKQENGGNMMDGIMASQYNEEMSEADLNKILNKAFAGLKRKQRHVLKRRFGLTNGEKKTLQEIGDSYGVTRERIRQIEKAAIKRLGKEVNYKHFSPVTYMAVFELEKAGGVLSEEALINRLLKGKNDELNANSLRLIFEVHPELYFEKECDYKNPSWRLENMEKDDVVNALKDIKKHLKDKKNVLKKEHIFDAVKEDHSMEMDLMESLLDMSKHVMETADGKFGLYEWTHINPKNIRDKIYFVLNKGKKPMHFLELTENIEGEDFIHQKKITHQAVHNELIADKRYVLIGKGIYALSEWGYKPGTVIDVIRSILEEKGEPMSKEDIIEEVKNRRIVKKNTIIINLHNKDHFERNKDGMFVIKEK